MLDQVVEGAEGEVIVEEVAEEFVDAAQGRVANEEQGEDELGQPRTGDGQSEEHVLGVRRGKGKGLRKGVVGLVALLGNELAADVVLLGEVGEGLGAGQGREGELLALQGGQQVCSVGLGRGGVAGKGVG